MNTGSAVALRPRPRAAWARYAVCLCTLTLLLVPYPGQALGQEAYPNLVPYPPADIYPSTPENYPSTPPYALRFDVTVANRGEVALDFKSENSSQDPDSKVAAQCVRWVARRICTRRYPAGEFVYHNAPGHNHYHITDFARYELRSVGEEAKPDMTQAGLVAGGQKVSFCVQDTEPDPETWSPTRPPNGIYYLCQNGKQGISPGHTDTYGSGLSGQEVVLPLGIQDGVYALVVTIDPTGRFYEGPRDDNVSYVLVQISRGGAVVSGVYG